MLGQRFFLLTMANHGLVGLERRLHGVHVPRYLNAGGRWAGSGKRVPLLVWEDRDEAQLPAEVATEARRNAVTVTEGASSSCQLDKSIRLFTKADAPALKGYVDAG